jgi:predicted RNA binding protein YcfA (HicA-like mRNA interferase family)
MNRNGVISDEKITLGRTKEFSCREFEQILMRNGFKYHHQKGDHRIWKRNSEIIVVTKKLNRMIARRLLKEYRLKF